MRALLAAVLLVASCKQAQPPPDKDGMPVREIAVTKDGYEPARVVVPAGKPAILRFTRKADPSCGDAVEVQGDPVKHALPLDVPVDVKVTAPASGELAFACPMHMFQGTVVVR
jgi:plastocyanin domain-containing protein